MPGWHVKLSGYLCSFHNWGANHEEARIYRESANYNRVSHVCLLYRFYGNP